jgi:hypothetical protein
LICVGKIFKVMVRIGVCSFSSGVLLRMEKYIGHISKPGIKSINVPWCSPDFPRRRNEIGSVGENVPSPFKTGLETQPPNIRKGISEVKGMLNTFQRDHLTLVESGALE